MIVDTSALVASVYAEPGSGPILLALTTAGSAVSIPAPVLVELNRVTSLDDNSPNPVVVALLDQLRASGASILPFDHAMAEEAAAANVRFGSGNGRGGKLNMLDLMVYAASKVSGLPILCTGQDFSMTDADIHPASRVG